MTYGQMGISDAITFSIGFMVELPSGVIADLIGRKKAILLGNVLMVIGNLLVGSSSTFLTLTSWYLIWTVGYAFQSGATEALVYDSVKKMGEEGNWQKIISTATIVGRATSLVAAVIGGLLFSVWFRLPYLTAGVLGIIGIVSAYFLIEIPVSRKVNFWSVSTYLKQIKDGVFNLIRPVVFPVSLISLFIAGISYMFNWGPLRPLTGIRFGYTTQTIPILLAVVSLAVIFSMYVLIKKKIVSEKKIFLFGALYAFLFFIMGFNHGWLVGGLIIILMAIFQTYVDQLFSTFINLHTSSEHRATTLSAVALFTRAPYVVLAILTGQLADKNVLPQFTLFVGAAAIIISVISFVLYLNKSQSNL